MSEDSQFVMNLETYDQLGRAATRAEYQLDDGTDPRFVLDGLLGRIKQIRRGANVTPRSAP